MQLLVWHWGHGGGEASWAILEKHRWLGKVSLFTIPDLKNSCHPDADGASDKTSRRSTSGSVVTLGGGVLNWAKKQKSVALSSWESQPFAASTWGTGSLGIQSELMDLG